MADSKNMLKYIGIALIAIVLLGFVLYGASWLIENLPAQLKAIGSAQTQTAIPADSLFGQIFQFLLGAPTPFTYESLAIFLAIFFIILFALAEIVEMFSTFSSTTSWVIAVGLAIIAGITKTIAGIAAIFGLTAGLGAIGIGIIIITAIISAMIINIGFGEAIQAWALKRQISVTSAKVNKGFAKAGDAAKALKDMATKMESD